MKKYLVLVCCLFFIAAKSDAQYVNIPDSNFRSFLIQQYPTCFDTLGRMDTTCSGVINEYQINCPNKNIKSIDGIQYFKKIQYLSCDSNIITRIFKLPVTLRNLNCSHNQIDSLPAFNLILSMDCSYNQLSHIEVDSVLHSPVASRLNISHNLFTNLSNIANDFYYIDCSSNLFTNLSLRKMVIGKLNADNNPIIFFEFPQNSFQVSLINNNLYCLPKIPNSLQFLIIDTSKILCLPFNNYYSYPYTYDQNNNFISMPICNPTNNVNQCHPFPIIKSFVYTDNNNNNKQDANELAKVNLKLTLSNDYTYTNTQGIAYTNADSLGTYTITAIAPNFYDAVPASYTHNFTSYDTLVIDTFALQPSVLKDSISIKLTPTNWAARAGRSYPYLVSYENVGTTVLTTLSIHFNYDSSLLIYDSSSVSGVTNNGNNLSLNVGNIVPGQTGSFVAYFTVKTTAALGSTVTSVANINAGSVNGTDSVTTFVRGSNDPNDKQATPNLTVAEVADNNHWIDYTIRFQNTGTDTAFNIVIADTLSPLVQWDQLQFKGSSHLCRTTVKGNVIFFEFIDIYLPDSNTNKTGSNGFVNFAVKPLTTLTNGTLVPNTASIYFDYNSPVVTNTAHTLIGSILPLTLVNFNAIPKEDENKIFVYWNTANEVNTSHFVIEQSIDGRTFKPVAEVAAKGSGSNSYFYSITKDNIVYLRLKMIDKNGTYTYSNIIKLSEDKSSGFDIVNNPTKGSLNINVRSISLNNTSAKIVNTQGQIVKTFILKHNLQTINITALQRGVYYLQTNLGTKKFVVE